MDIKKNEITALKSCIKSLSENTELRYIHAVAPEYFTKLNLDKTVLIDLFNGIDKLKDFCKLPFWYDSKGKIGESEKVYTFEELEKIIENSGKEDIALFIKENELIKI